MKNNLLSRIKTFIVLFLLLTSTFGFAQQSSDYARLKDGAVKSVSEKNENKNKVNKQLGVKGYTPSEDATFYEDFEAYEDWSTSFGEWTMIDGNAPFITVGLGIQIPVTGEYLSYTFPGESTQFAYIILNPALVEMEGRTETPFHEIHQAHSGSKIACSINSWDGGMDKSRATLKADKWMITPKVTLGDNDVFSFFAKSGSYYFPKEKYEILISISSTETTSFTKIYESETNDDVWRKQSFLLKDAGYANQDVYIAIRKISNPAPSAGSGDIFFVDDVEIYPAPTTPVAEIDSISWDAGYVISGTEVSDANYFTLKNIGLGKLTINSITDLSGTDFSTTLIPVNVNLGWQETLTFGFTYHPLEYGVDNMDFVISTSGGDVIINLLGVSPQESFEDGVLPEAWKVINADGGSVEWVVNKSRPQTGEYCARINGEGLTTQSNDFIVTPALNIEAGREDVISFWLREYGYYVEFQNYEVLLSTTGTDVEDFTIRLDDESNYEFSYNYRMYEFNLDEYDGNVVYVAIRYKAMDDWYMVYIDDFMLPEIFKPENDMWAKELNGNFNPTNGLEKVYELTVKNYGKLDQSSYAVQLVKANEGAADEVLKTITVNQTLSAGAENVINIPYVFTTTEDLRVYGKVILSADENLNNNKTENYFISVLPEGQIATIVGDGDETRMILPTWPSQDNTLSEIIYMAGDLDGQGLLTHISYFNNFKSDAMFNEPVRIWACETMRTSLNDNQGWIPSTEMTLVYDGTVTFPTGINEIEIELHTPYAYMRQNLVIMFERNGESTNDDNRFFGEVTNYDGCSLNCYNEVDPANPPAIGGEINVNVNSEVPKTKFKFNTNTGKLEGRVSDVNGNLDGVNVLIDETPFETYTLANGYYIFPYIFTETFNMTFILHGYYDKYVQGVEIIKDQTVVNDVVMTILPEISVNGYVITTDFPDQGLEDAEIRLEGYGQIYTGITIADGTFSIPNVYGDKSYNVTIVKDGYEIYTEEITVSTGDFTLENVTLTEIAYMVEFVEANGDDVSMTVNWNKPGSGSETQYAYENGQHEWSITGEGYGNVWLGNKFPVTEKGIITGIDIFGYEKYPGTGKVSLDIFNSEQKLVWTSEPFLIKADEWFTVDVPEINYDGLFYAMVHWDNTCISTNTLLLAVNENNNAMYYDRIQGFNQFSDMNGGINGPFLIRASAMVYGQSVKYDPNNIENVQKSNVNSKHFTLNEVNGVAPENTKPENKNSATKALETYKVYRGFDGNDFAAYIELTPTAIADPFLVDSDWAILEDGTYRYAVKGIYTNGIESAPVYSNIVNNGTPVQVTVNVTTNEQDENNVERALLILTNQNGISDYVYKNTVPANGQVQLTMALGTYDILVLKSGFFAYEQSSMEIIDGTVIEIVLTETIISPNDLFVSNKNEGKADFTWNNNFDVMEESFEDDFLSGNNGWQWIDNDGDGFNWMIADAAVSFPTHSGSYAIGSQSYDPNSGTLTPDNYLITPALKIGPDYSLSYWVAATDPTYFAEDYKVLVSTTGTEIKDFDITLTDEQLTQNEAGIYTLRSLDLSKFAGQTIYIAWVHYGVDQWIMLLDDVKVGPDNSSKSFMNYEVSLNGVVKGSTTETSMEYTGLVSGTDYVAGVRSVYSSGKSEIATYNFTYILQNANCTIKVSTNEEASSAIGAEITLTNNDDNPEHVYNMTVPDGGELSINIATGTYSIIVSQDGFETFEDYSINIIDDTNIDVVLIEKKSAPFNLVVNNSIEGTANFSWESEDYSTKSLVGFKTYLDGVELGITSEKSYMVTGLIDGIEYTFGVKAFYSTGESEMATMKHTYSKVTGLENVDYLSINVYPNPANNILNITNVKGGTIQIYNVIGNLVKLIENAEEMNSIDVSSYVKGNYFIRIVLDKNITVKKVGIVK